MFDSERKPRRQDRWDKVHLRTVSTHLREEEDALFRVACSLERTTRYAVMQALEARGDVLGDILVGFEQKVGVALGGARTYARKARECFDYICQCGW